MLVVLSVVPIALHALLAWRRSRREAALTELRTADVGDDAGRDDVPDVDEEQELGVRCYAVSIPKAPAPMAVSVSGPLSRVDEAFGDRAVPVLRAIADRVSTELIN